MTPEQEALVLKFKYLPLRIANKYRAENGFDVNDGVGLGMLTLVKAAKSYVDDGRAKFVTYAYRSIDNELRRNMHNICLDDPDSYGDYGLGQKDGKG